MYCVHSRETLVKGVMSVATPLKLVNESTGCSLYSLIQCQVTQRLSTVHPLVDEHGRSLARN